MNTQQRQHSEQQALQRTTNNMSQHAADFGSQGPANGQGQNEHMLVHFSGHFNGQFDGAFIVPNTVYQSTPAESDAQIAARRAMAKRSSRSFASRISRTRSRKMEVVGRSAKPGITVDTSFARHRGNAPHQMYPPAGEIKSGGSIRKQGWFGLGRSNTKTKGLGITKGTPLPEASQDEPRTADSVTPGSKTWQEISPWDRPIPIGLSVPSNSVTDFSPYRSTRNRSDSDATLATPSIIITPAAMKSVWSPDTDSDYTPARASSIYSRATYMQSDNSPVPPVPALPAGMAKLSSAKPANDDNRGPGNSFSLRNRSDTLDSSGTAFEEEDDTGRKDRIMSTGTVFEEDNTPLRDDNAHATLAPDTATTPNPRRSQGWWNVITTPFMVSRSNSVWTQQGPQVQTVPAVPMVPAGQRARDESPSTPSTYIWSATEKSPSFNGDGPLTPLPLKTLAPQHKAAQTDSNPADPGVLTKMPPVTIKKVDNADNLPATNSAPFDTPKKGTGSAPSKQTADASVASPFSAMSATPVVSTAEMGTVLMPRQVGNPPEPQTVAINIELQDRRAQAQVPAPQPTASAGPSKLTIKIPSPKTDRSPPEIKKSKQAVPVFPPPPTFAQKSARSGHRDVSGDASPTSTTDPKEKKQHRKIKVGSMMDQFALCRRNKKGKKSDKKQDKKQDKNQKKKRTICFWCCGCCFVILILLAILIPIVVVFTKKHSNEKPIETPSQWLNLTGYPPIPTGVSTIAQPEAVKEETGCIAPATAWSCAVPKEEQQDISPNKADQPNFKFEIIFQNGTVANASSTVPLKRALNPVSAGAFIRSRVVHARATPSASPAVPSIADQQFLGNTTDKNSAPSEGEDTPFFISFQDAKASSSSRRLKRQSGGNNITDLIPPPSLNSDGTAAAANLLTYPSNQPLRLFNRGKADEHYGFYTYYDRAIFLKTIENTSGRGGNPSDTNGGSARDAAQFRCTYSQTRFLVQMWTNSQSTKPMLRGSAGNATDPALSRPGTFPYPVTVTIDRHGGDASKKNMYCYRMQNDTSIINTTQNKFVILEDRGFGGVLADPMDGNTGIKTPIDGGSGGCGCTWQNWLA